MKQRKNAFTLIELLAVIIILAAIALIIAPLVLDIIKEQQMKTFKESINGILRSSRLEIVNSGLSFPATFTYSDGKLLSPTGKELKVTGKIPEGTGSVRYNSEDNIDLAITDNTWCGTYNKTSKEVEVNAFNGTCEVAIAYTPEKCFTFDSSTGTITKYNKSDNDCGVDVVIPETINGKIVRTIGSYAFVENWDGDWYNKPTKEDAKKLNSVVFSSGLEEIKSDAFLGYKSFYNSETGNYDEYHFNQITALDFSKAINLQMIEARTFSSNQLTRIDFSNLVNLITIGSKAFVGNQLTNVTFGSINKLETIGCAALINPDNSTPDYDVIPSSVIFNEGFGWCPPE